MPKLKQHLNTSEPSSSDKTLCNQYEPAFSTRDESEVDCEKCRARMAKHAQMLHDALMPYQHLTFIPVPPQLLISQLASKAKMFALPDKPTHIIDVKDEHGPV